MIDKEIIYQLEDRLKITRGILKAIDNLDDPEATKNSVVSGVKILDVINFAFDTFTTEGMEREEVLNAVSLYVTGFICGVECKAQEIEQETGNIT
jgi:hypothetical protein